MASLPFPGNGRRRRQRGRERLEGVGRVSPGRIGRVDSAEAGAAHRLLAVGTGEGGQQLGGVAHLTPWQRDPLPAMEGAREP
jgi:hypothetical protein